MIAPEDRDLLDRLAVVRENLRADLARINAEILALKVKMRMARAEGDPQTCPGCDRRYLAGKYRQGEYCCTRCENGHECLHTCPAERMSRANGGR